MVKVETQLCMTEVSVFMINESTATTSTGKQTLTEVYLHLSFPDPF